MSIVGIDPSLTACGIAVLGRESADSVTWTGQLIRSDVVGTAGIVDLRTVGRDGKETDGFPQRSDRIVWTSRVAMKYIPDDVELVVIEDLPYMKRPLPSYRDRCVLWGGIYSAIRARKIPIAVCNNATRARWATGAGNANKAAVLAAVREQWPHSTGRDDNEADALTLASMGALHLDWQLPFEIKPRHYEGLTKVEWPKEMTDV